MKNLMLLLTLFLFLFTTKIKAQGQFVGLGLHSNYTGYNLVLDYTKKIGKSEFSLGLKYLFRNPTGQFDEKVFEHKYYPDTAIEHWGINADFRHFYAIKGTNTKLGWFCNLQFTRSAVDALLQNPISMDTIVLTPYHSQPVSTLSTNIGLVMEVPLNENILFSTGIGGGINFWDFSKKSGVVQRAANTPTVFAEVKINLDRFKKE